MQLLFLHCFSKGSSSFFLLLMRASDVLEALGPLFGMEGTHASGVKSILELANSCLWAPLLQHSDVLGIVLVANSWLSLA